MMNGIASTLHQVIKFLKANIEVLAWTPYKMLVIDPSFIKHELNVIPEARLVKHQGRMTAIKHVDTVIEEVKKLKEASAITEVLYPNCLSHIIVVKKKTSKWRMYINFISLNRACLKEYFPLPKIDQWMDSTSYHARMNLLDTYRGYHQIAIHKPD